MQNITQINKVLKILKNNKVIILYCVSLYPAPFNLVNLNFIERLKKKFNLSIGFSDHSQGIELSIAAVAKGAKLIEKHIMLSKKNYCPDYNVSLTPNEFKKMVNSIRNIEQSIKKNKYVISGEEKKAKKLILKGAYINKDIKKGQILINKDIFFKKPQGDISIDEIDKYINKKFHVNLKKDSLILKKYLK